MINFNSGQQQAVWPPTLDQDGNVVTHNMVQQERMSEFGKILDKGLPEFEKALAKRCEERNEVYNNLGFDQRFGANLYQVGMAVYAILVGPDGLSPQQVGQIG